MAEPSELVISEALRYFHDPARRGPEAFVTDSLYIAQGAAHYAVSAENERRGLMMSDQEYEDLTSVTCEVVLKLIGTNNEEQGV